jgi:hypothetical protein
MALLMIGASRANARRTVDRPCAIALLLRRSAVLAAFARASLAFGGASSPTASPAS